MITRVIRNNFKIILAVGLTAIICISGTAFATGYLAKDITYTRNGTNINSVEDALNDLYNKQREYVMPRHIFWNASDSSGRIYGKIVLPDLTNYKKLEIDSINISNGSIEYIRLCSSSNEIISNFSVSDTRQSVDISMLTGTDYYILSYTQKISAWGSLTFNNIKLF